VEPELVERQHFAGAKVFMAWLRLRSRVFKVLKNVTKNPKFFLQKFEG
jgi:hypothetical protein